MAPDVKPDKRLVKWYLKPVAIFIAIAATGPFAIPLVWISPAFKRWQKIALTLAIILFTLWIIRSSIDLYRILLKEMLTLQEALKGV